VTRGRGGVGARQRTGRPPSSCAAAAERPRQGWGNCVRDHRQGWPAARRARSQPPPGLGAAAARSAARRRAGGRGGGHRRWALVRLRRTAGTPPARPRATRGGRRVGRSCACAAQPRRHRPGRVQHAEAAALWGCRCAEPKLCCPSAGTEKGIRPREAAGAAPGVEGAPGGGWQRLGWRAPRARRRKPPGEELAGGSSRSRGGELAGGSSRNPSRQRRDERAPECGGGRRRRAGGSGKEGG